MQIPKGRLEKMKVRDESPIHLTEEGFVRLKKKLERLKDALPHYITETQKAAAYGDRSDSAEYKDAKSTLRRTHRQILKIQDQIKRAVIIKTGANTSGKIQLGSTVVLKNKDQKTFQIVGPQETNPSMGRISHQSPLGSALLGHRKGDTVTIKTERGQQEYTILEIR